MNQSVGVDSVMITKEADAARKLETPVPPNVEVIAEEKDAKVIIIAASSNEDVKAVMLSVKAPEVRTAVSPSVQAPETECFRGIPTSLPPMHEVSEWEYRGPTCDSNWVVAGSLLVGGQPGWADDNVHFESLEKLATAKVRTIVNLQEEYNPAATPEQWSDPLIPRPYMEDYRQMCASMGIEEKVTFLHCPIEDMTCGDASNICRLALNVAFRVLNREVVYVHCRGGHGRTGVIVAVVLMMLYGISVEEALLRTQRYHDMREDTCSSTSSPQTEKQRNRVSEVSRMIAQMDQFPLLKTKFFQEPSATSFVVHCK